MENQKETQKNPQYKYASTREKLCFGIGAIGKDAICNLVGAFLMLYFTDTLYLAPAFVGVLFLVARIWDGAYIQVPAYSPCGMLPTQIMPLDARFHRQA